MLHIVTGDRDSGKSRFLMEHHESHPQGDGIIALKVFVEEKIVGYDAYFIGQNKRVPLMRYHDALPDDFPRGEKIGSFYYDAKTFMMMNAYLINLIQKKTSPLYVDEIGRLEFKGHGLDRVMKYGFHPDEDVYLVIRDEFVREAISHYRLRPEEIIDVGAKRYV
ncbi:MAG: nucleoside-triphosphatase [Bacilli bacterium]|jgi:nucleoside-triphosphatase THEP1